MYSYFIYVCQAICVKQIYNLVDSYILISQNSNGVMTVNCDSGLYLLGCGYRSIATEDYWYVYPQSQSCVCYNYYNGECMATCARVFDLGLPNCTNCYSDKCTSNGCSQCLDGYFVNNQTNTCVKKPCYEICTNCTTEESCEMCYDCTQGISSNNITCSNPVLLQYGCIPCSEYYYLLPDDNYCTTCSKTTNPDKFRNGSSDGTGRCENCHNLVDDCYSCNEITYTCESCQTNFYLTTNNICQLQSINDIESIKKSHNKQNSSFRRFFNHKKGNKPHTK